MNSSKLVKISAAILAILILVLVIGKSAGWIGKKKSEKVSAEEVQRRTITEITTANGKIEPETEVIISPDVSGEIVELWVKEGQTVKEGQLLLKINPDIYQSALERATAALNSAYSNLANSRSRLAQVKAQFKQKELAFKRNKKLFEQKTISQADYETAEATFEVAKAEVDASQQSVKASEFQTKSAAASVKEAKENLSRTTLYAPMDGTISRLNVEKGERVVGTMQMAGTEMLRVANLNRMQLKVNVNENDILKVSLGDTAIIEIDAYLDLHFKGIVTEIANSAILANASTDQVTNFEVKILLLAKSYKQLIEKNKHPFRPGMSATADIQTKTRHSVLSVPIQAVTTRSDTTKTNKKKDNKKDLKEVVFIEENGKAKITFVKTGIQNNDYIEITEGLTEEQLAITGPYRTISKKLKHNTLVTITDKEKLFK